MLYTIEYHTTTVSSLQFARQVTVWAQRHVPSVLHGLQYPQGRDSCESYLCLTHGFTLVASTRFIAVAQGCRCTVRPEGPPPWLVACRPLIPTRFQPRSQAIVPHLASFVPPCVILTISCVLLQISHHQIDVSSINSNLSIQQHSQPMPTSSYKSQDTTCGVQR